jgi:hypothetical protein
MFEGIILKYILTSIDGTFIKNTTDGEIKMISNIARARIIEAAKEIIDARTNIEMDEAVRAMMAVLAHFKISTQ